jgi:hypothetical protein
MALLGSADSGELFAMLFGYFDESGTDIINGQTVIAGFVAPLSEWADVMTEWNLELDRANVRPFHRVECRGRNGSYKGWSAAKALAHIEKLAGIIAHSSLQSVSASFSGDWNNLGLPQPFYARFPHPYHVCFELLASNIVDCAKSYGQNRVCLILERQDQFSLRAQKIYDVHKFNNKWAEIVNFTYADKATCPYLQCADHFAWEVRRYFWAAKNNKKNNADFPLIRRLIGKPDYQEGHLGTFLDEAGMRVVANNPLPNLDFPPGFTWA